MNLQIRDPRARQMARQLARLNGGNMTDAVIDALDFRLKHIADKQPLEELAAALSHDLRQRAKTAGRDISKDEIDQLWGHVG